jgi:hypothetical protein
MPSGHCMYCKTWKKYFCGKCLYFSFLHTNNAYQVIIYVHTQLHCYVSLQTLYPAGFKYVSSCSWGGCDVHCATPPGHCKTFFKNYHPHTPAGFDLTTHNYPNGDYICMYTTRPRHPGRDCKAMTHIHTSQCTLTVEKIFIGNKWIHLA